MDAACARVPIDLIAMWAMVGVLTVVNLVRLRDDDFGLGVGAALFAIGAAALVLLIISVRADAPPYVKRGGVNAKHRVLWLHRNDLKAPGSDEYL